MTASRPHSGLNGYDLVNYYFDGRGNYVVPSARVHVMARYARDLEEQFETLHAAAIRLIEAEDADQEAIDTLMEVDTGEDAQDYQRRTRQAADAALDVLKALVSIPAKRPSDA